jgi:hypothetical protein
VAETRNPILGASCVDRNYSSFGVEVHIETAVAAFAVYAYDLSTIPGLT